MVRLCVSIRSIDLSVGSVYLVLDRYYQRKSSERLKTVLEFSRSEDFETSIILAIITSVPRWEFAQSLEKKVEEEGEPRGIARAISKFSRSTRCILRGEDRLLCYPRKMKRLLVSRFMGK